MTGSLDLGGLRFRAGEQQGGLRQPSRPFRVSGPVAGLSNAAIRLGIRGDFSF